MMMPYPTNTEHFESDQAINPDSMLRHTEAMIEHMVTT